MYPWVRRINGTRAGPPGPYSLANFAVFAVKHSPIRLLEKIKLNLGQLLTGFTAGCDDLFCWLELARNGRLDKIDMRGG